MGTFLKAVKAGWAKLKKALAAAWRWYKGQFAGRPWWRKTLAAIVSFFAFILLYAVAVTCNLFWLFGKSPSISEIRNPKTAMASEMYSADGKLLGKFFNENRSPVPYDSINSVFFQALISTEDERFYDHHGVDVQGLFAALKDATQGRARGASTISQQLVKNMFRVRTQYSTGLLGKVPGLSILIMKSKEMIIATELELLCTKNEILEMYANTVDFGSNAFGIKTAAKTYFNTTPSQLKPEEAAVLVGLLKATSAYNPKINPKNSLKRRNTVLDNMYAHRKELAEHFPNVAIASKEVCEALKDKPIKLNFSVENAYQGTALYFREAVKDYVREHCPDLDLDRDGLKIYTTLDSRMQRYAEEAVDEQMQNVQRSFDNHWRGLGDPWRDAKGNVIPNFIEDIARRSDAYKMLVARYPNNPDSVRHYMNKPHRVKLFGYGEKGRVKYEEMSTMDSIRYMVKYMHTGFVAMEPQTGYVRAYVGDIDFKTWKYDKVQAMRQPGSTFKLFVYATAMKQGWTPADARITDSYIRMEVYDPAQGKNTIWQPHNANGHFSNANIPLRAAFAQSVNTIAVKLGQEVGIDNVIQTAHDMGITSKLENAPALALGSNDVTLFEMVNAYASVANDGMHVAPVLVTKIVDADGRTVYEAKHEEKRALPYRAAFYMQKLLEAGVRDGGGTSQTLGGSAYLGRYGNQLDFGGKTGTSNNHSDAWFIGVTPGLVGGAWVGGEYRSIHFRSGRLGQGSRTALPIFGLFMKKVLEDERLKGKYMLKYPAPKEDIEPSTYQGYFAPPAEEADSLSADSTYVGDDLMGTGADPAAAEQPAGKAAEAADENAANNLFE
ncbi:MAG: transglycosylase domain-containing protein [Alloprevotella sp.]